MSQDFSVLDHVPLGAFVLDAQCSVRFWNRVLEDWSGIPRAHILEQPIEQFFPHIFEHGLRLRLQSIFAGGPPILLSHQFHGALIPSRLHSGQMRIQKTTVKAIRIPDHRGFFALFSIQDITGLTNRVYEYRDMRDQARAEAHERKLAEQALAQREAMYRSLVETSPAAILVTNPEGQIILANPQAEITFAVVGSENFSGHHFDEWVMPDALVQAETQFARVLEQGMLLNAQLLLRRHQGEPFIAEINATCINDADGSPHFVMLMITDISERLRAQAAIARYAEQMGALYNTALEINSQMELNALLYSIVQRATTLLNAPIGEIYLDSHESGVYERLIRFPLDESSRTIRAGEGLAGQVIAQNAPIVIQENQAAWDFANEHVGRAIGIPLRVRGRTIGVITVQDTKAGTLSSDDVLLMTLFADQAAIAIENARLYQQVMRLAVTDPLTGVYNRRGFFEMAERILERNRRNGVHTSLIAIDVDHFKRVNDTYGHAAGDVVLQQMGAQCRSALRVFDLVGRMGGEEFVILLSEADAEGTYLVAERLRKTVAGLEIPAVLADGNTARIRITISEGVAQFTRETDELATIMERADNALYTAKLTGRNRVVVWEPALEAQTAATA